MNIIELGSTDVLVIGGGLSAMYAAINAERMGVNTVIVSKKRIVFPDPRPFLNQFIDFLWMSLILKENIKNNY